MTRSRSGSRMLPLLPCVDCGKQVRLIQGSRRNRSYEVDDTGPYQFLDGKPVKTPYDEPGLRWAEHHCQPRPKTVSERSRMRVPYTEAGPVVIRRPGQDAIERPAYTRNELRQVVLSRAAVREHAIARQQAKRTDPQRSRYR